jgi:photosystem II stability/assembly factor-like uncharacterized protein
MRCSLRYASMTLCLVTISMLMQAQEFPKVRLTPYFKDAVANWKVHTLVGAGRMDALAEIAPGVVVCGSRGEEPGKLFISEDAGLHWKALVFPVKENITAIAGTGNRFEFYVLTGNGLVFRTNNGGKSFQQTALKLNHTNRDGAQQSYGLCYLPTGTLLVSATQSEGGHLYRSTDKGKTFIDLGKVGNNALYRFQNTPNGIFVNGFDGGLYKSVNDGKSWNQVGQLSTMALFATEYLENGHLLQADQKGTLYVFDSKSHQIDSVAQFPGAADDFISLGHGLAYYSTYTEGYENYFTPDFGKHWFPIGAIQTHQKEDWIDHGISLRHSDSVIVLGATRFGAIVRNAFSNSFLELLLDKSHKTYWDTAVQAFRYPRIKPVGQIGNLIPNASFEAGAGGQ